MINVYRECNTFGSGGVKCTSMVISEGSLAIVAGESGAHGHVCGTYLQLGQITDEAIYFFSIANIGSFLKSVTLVCL